MFEHFFKSRFGLKATKKINWKQFLASLRDPQWTEVNSTVPLTRKTRYVKMELLNFCCTDHNM